MLWQQWGKPDEAGYMVCNDASVEALLSQLALIECLGGRAVFEKLKRRLDNVNGERRQRLVTLEGLMIGVLGTLRRKTTRDYSVIHGGSVNRKSLKWGEASTTLALVVKTGECSVICDVGLSAAYRPWPSKVWPELAPWKLDMQPDRERLAAWVKSRSRIFKQLYLWEESDQC